MNFIRNLKIILTLIIFASGLTLKAQNDTASFQKFSLVDAQKYAVQNNATAKNSAIDIEIAKKKVWETTAIGLPQVNLKGTFQHQFSVPSLTMFVPAGPPDAQGAYDKVQPMTFDLGSKSNTTFDLTVSQLIFSGEYLVGLQASRVYKSFSEKSYEKSVSDINETVAQTYYLVLVLNQNKEILDSSYTNMLKIQNDMEAMLKQGFIEETDFEQIKLTVLNVKNAEISLNRQTDVAYNLMKLQLGLDYTAKIELTDKLEDFLNQSNMNKLIIQQFELNNNIDYQMIGVQENLMTLSYKRQMSKFLPTLAAFYQHEKQMNAATLNFVPSDVIGVTLSLPIFSSGQRTSQLSQAKMQLDQVQNTKEQVAVGLNVQFEKAKNDFLAAQDKFTNLKENYALSKSIYDKTLIKYKQGVSSGLDLTQVQNQYFQAQSNYFQAMVELLNSKAALEKILNNNQ
jgi:outer membrane protein TolC